MSFPYRDTINRLPDEKRFALYRSIAAKIAEKDGLDYDKVREFGAPGGGPNKNDFEKAAGCVIDFLHESELTLEDVAAILARHEVAA